MSATAAGLGPSANSTARSAGRSCAGSGPEAHAPTATNSSAFETSSARANLVPRLGGDLNEYLDL